MKRIIEICANSAQSCVEAEAGGATRVELCAGIPEGGTTPSYGEIKTAKALTSKSSPTWFSDKIWAPGGALFQLFSQEIYGIIRENQNCGEIL